MNIEKRVRELVEEKIADWPELFLVDVKMQPNGKLIILVDGDKGVGVNDCAQISRHVGFHLEEESAIDTAYNLEVSSPGVDTPLTLPRCRRCWRSSGNWCSTPRITGISILRANMG